MLVGFVRVGWVVVRVLRSVLDVFSWFLVLFFGFLGWISYFCLRFLVVVRSWRGCIVLIVCLMIFLFVFGFLRKIFLVFR